MENIKTPGVYIVEKNAFPNSVVEAGTAIPAFIGITEKAQNGNDDLTGIPWRISSMAEYLQYFGGAPKAKFMVDIKKYFYLSEKQKKNTKTLLANLAEPATKVFKYCVCPIGETEKIVFDNNVGIKESDAGEDTPVGYAFCIDVDNRYTLYYNMMLFFANGGGTCYVVSEGSYGNKNSGTLNYNKVGTALTALEKIQEVTLIIVPEAVESDTCANIQQLMLKHCGEMENRFAILDVSSKYSGNEPLNTRLETFRESIGNSYMSYGAAYFPWLNTSILGNKDLTGEMFSWSDSANSYIIKFSQSDSMLQNIMDLFRTKVITAEKDNVAKIKNDLHKVLDSGSVIYRQAMKAVLKYMNLLPPSAAMAGIYTMVDNSRGVWKAPANVTLNYVTGTAEDICDYQQENFNAPINGKSINVIRFFSGEGVKVWGARTLDGNSPQWRYIIVRRTLSFLKESVKNAVCAYVFEPNDAGTWLNVKCMIENFLLSVWKRGGLAGDTSKDAFEVHVGLGDTMTCEDVIEGIMRITVLVRIGNNIADFVEITFQQQMQKS
ncbi:MAG: phage tail sheath subtilisin-like domain-containing protein [Bacteroidales bacterium]